jgi:hypothetical protein
LHIVATGPVSALGDAVRADTRGWLRTLGGVCVQGQAEVGGGEGA